MPEMICAFPESDYARAVHRLSDSGSRPGEVQQVIAKSWPSAATVRTTGQGAAHLMGYLGEVRALDDERTRASLLETDLPNDTTDGPPAGAASSTPKGGMP
ncbi:hypothetical protein [Streptomyces sp. NBC_00347]|uniref:hypothetical protein n=1 Tax=Streptomyces sp. NBC_00347 TaxID=2975721 RepID=UPI00225B9FC7|nr:hypothetical protein [Streptomyces sp. NBC_00347]MCX5126767.1 hypothetical protein [Streptomyces sp. NBC_00347]